MKRICFVLLLCILSTLGGCYTGHPRYQPFSLFPAQGYKDIAIDDRTYLVFYTGYYSGSLKNVYLPDRDALDEKWLRGAQEYALYRAGELAKSKKAEHFVVLYQDDWNLQDNRTYSGKGPPIILPSAGLMIRVLNESPSLMLSNDDRIYEVDKLLQNVAEKNGGLAEYQNKTSPNGSMKHAWNSFSRWRSSVSGYDSVPVPGHWEDIWYGPTHFKFESGISTTKRSNGNFEVARWEAYFSPTMPIALLRDCVLLADGMGFEVFKLRNWAVEEHRADTRLKGHLGSVWFRMTAEVVLQHHKEPDSLDPVFVVDEIRPHVMDYKW